MDENEWLNATDPMPMLRFLPTIGETSERKMRLFAVACCRLLLRTVRVSTLAGCEVDVAERYADGAASIAELEQARCYSNSLAEHACMNAAEIEAGVEMADCAALNAAWAAARAECATLNPAWAAATPYSQSPVDAGLNTAFNARLRVEQAIQCKLFRDIVANPFSAPRPIQAAWLRWNDGTVLRIATGIYEERAFERMPVLADALLDAGCDDEAMLEHCREQEGVHARGCWVIDLLLGKR